MSNSTPRPASPVHPTRQQLDELDALMQRMLALPVNQLDEDLATVAVVPSMAPLPEWESAPEEPSLLSAEMEEDKETRRPGEQENESPDFVSVPEPVMRTPLVVRSPEEDQETRRPGDQEKGPSNYVSVFEKETRKQGNKEEEAASAASLSPSLPVSLSARSARPLRAKRDRPGLGLRLLRWSNRTFDRNAGRLGGTGRWLRGRYGRAVLGLTGLLLLVAALVLGALDWIGWTW